MTFALANKRMGLENIRKRHGDAIVLDLTSRGTEPYVRFSPFYPHGGIPVPFSPGFVSQSVEGIWQGLKVFETQDIDPSKFAITNMKGIKRTVRTCGKVLGHREGVNGERLLTYAEARRSIYLPTYVWVLENHLQSLLTELRQVGKAHTVVLLDYETNTNIADLSQPLSHAGLVVRYLNDDWPS